MQPQGWASSLGPRWDPRLEGQTCMECIVYGPGTSRRCLARGVGVPVLDEEQSRIVTEGRWRPKATMLMPVLSP